jgi:hypothetical protein
MAGRPPIFQALAERLKAQLAAGAWSDGLPAERALAAALKVSRTTLRKALDALAATGARPALRRADWPRVLFIGQHLGHVNDRIADSMAAICEGSGMHVDRSLQAPYPPWPPRQREAIRAAASGCRCLVANSSDIAEVEGLGLPTTVVRLAYGFHQPRALPPGWQVVIADRRQAAHEAVGHLHDLGHRRIGLVCGGDPGDRQQPWGRPWRHDATWLGWSAAIAAYGLQPGTVLCPGHDDDRWPALVARWLRLRRRPTALVLDMDWRARPFLACGLRIPGDLSLASSGDTPWAVAGTPQLTSWSYQPEAIGRLLALLAANGPVAAGAVHAIAPRRVDRGSCAPPG